MKRRDLIKGLFATSCSLYVLNFNKILKLRPEDFLELDGGMVKIKPEAQMLDDCTEVFRLATDIARTIYLPSGTYKMYPSI